MPLVLLIDDDEQRLAVLAHCFGRLGCRTAAARSGVSAFRCLEEDPPILIVLNLALQDREGLEAFFLMAPKLPLLVLHTPCPRWPNHLPVVGRHSHIYESNDLLGMLMTLSSHVQHADDGLSALRGLAETAR
jgi:hypothetical protein